MSLLHYFELLNAQIPTVCGRANFPTSPISTRDGTDGWGNTRYIGSNSSTRRISSTNSTFSKIGHCSIYCFPLSFFFFIHPSVCIISGLTLVGFDLDADSISKPSTIYVYALFLLLIIIPERREAHSSLIILFMPLS